MKKNILFSSLLVLLFSSAHAELKTLDNQQLQQVEGQASAATINWTLSLNQTSSGVFDSTTCSDLRFCRFAVSFNNRYDDGSYIDRTGTIRNAAGTAITVADHTGRKYWLVLKGIQGTIQINDLQLDGADLLYKDDSDNNQIKAALQLGFAATSPIKIRNFGFNAVSIETDTDRENNPDGTVNTGNTPGYLAMGSGGTNIYKYTNGKYDYSGSGLLSGYGTSSFDHGLETGFTGLMMNGNLALQGTLKVFSCDASMKRC